MRRPTPPPTDLFRELVESIQDYAIFALDRDGYILTWNRGGEKLKGYTPREIIGKHFSIFYPPEALAEGKPQHMLDTAARYEHAEDEGWRVRRDGSRFWANVVVTALRNAEGQLTGFAKVTRDLTKRREMQNALLESARRLAAEEAERRAAAAQAEEFKRLNTELDERANEERALRMLAQTIAGAGRIPELMHDIASGALAVSEADGAYVEQVIQPGEMVEVVAAAGMLTPPCGQRLTYPGSLTEEIIARREPVFLTRMEGVGAAMAPYLSTHCQGCSVLVLPLVGETRALGALVLVRRAEERPFEYGVITRVRTLGDLASIALQRLAALEESDRRRAEAEAAVRVRDEVLSIVSHDLRNPLSTVSMSTALLRDPEIRLTDEQQRQQLEIIARSAQRMNRLIQDLLDVARIEGGRFTITCRCEDPSSIAVETCDAFRVIAEERALMLRCDIERGLPPVFVDRDRIIQVLSNFLNNAMKFTPAGGRVTLSAERDERSEAGDGIRYAVSDTGGGIDPDDLGRVFDRYWQAKRTAHLGSGLGLAIAKGIADAHHGRVWVESEAGKGSTFYLALGVAAAQCE